MSERISFRTKLAILLLCALALLLTGILKTFSQTEQVNRTSSKLQNTSPSAQLDRPSKAIFDYKASAASLRNPNLPKESIPETLNSKSLRETDIGDSTDLYAKEDRIHFSEEISLEEILAETPVQEDTSKAIEDAIKPPSKDSFDEQDIDANWAVDEEYRFISLFSEKESLASYALRSSKCREDQCKLVIALSVEQKRDELTQAVANALLEEKGSFGLALPSGSDSEVAVYISDLKKHSPE